MKRKNTFLAIGLPLMMLAIVIGLLLILSRSAEPPQTVVNEPVSANQTAEGEKAQPTSPGQPFSGVSSVNAPASGGSSSELDVVFSAEEPAVLPADLPEPPSDFTVDQGLKRYRIATVALEPERHVRTNPGSSDERPQPADRTFQFELFPGTSFIGISQTHQQHASDKPRGVYVGTLAGFEGSIFTLAYHGDDVAGSITIPGRASFVMLPASPGFVRIGEVDPSKLRFCQPGASLPPSALTWNGGELPPAGYTGGESVTYEPFMAASATATVVDVLIVFSNQAALRYGSISALQAVVDSDFAYANQGMVNSQVDLYLNQAGFEPVDYDDSGDIGADLDVLTFPEDGILDEVRQMRKDANADLVSMYIDLETVEEGGVILGVAWVNLTADRNRFGYSVVRPQFGPVTFVHELGHNMGCLHDRENTPPFPGAQDYSYGWRFVGNDDILYHTIMAYQPGIAIPHFSNPNVNFAGKPTGVPVASSMAAFNAQTLNENKDFVAAFSELSDDPGDLEVLTPPFNLRASRGLYHDAVQLEWNGPGPFYRILRSTDNNFSNATLLAEVAGGASTGGYLDDSVLPGVNYYYWVRTIDEFGQFSPATGPVMGNTIAPTQSAPGGVTATKGSELDFVRVKWNPVGEKNGYRLSYEIFRAESLAHPTGVVFSFGDLWLGDREFEDAEALPGVHYYYWVRAVFRSRTTDEVIYGNYGGPAEGYKKLPPPVQAASGLQVTNGNPWTDINIRWNAASNADRYHIMRGETASPDARELIVVVSKNEPREYADWTAVPGVQYYYWVRGVNAVSEGAFDGPEPGIDTASPAPPKTTGVNATNGGHFDKIRVTWNPTSGAANYVIYRSEDYSFGNSIVLVDGTLPFGGSTGYYDDREDLVLGQDYYYWVAAISSDDLVGPPGGPAKGSLKRQPPPAPEDLSASDGLFVDFVSVSWLPSPTATSYRVYRWGEFESVQDAEFLLETSNTSIQDTTAVPEVVYNYAVAAKNSSGEGALSESDTGFRYGIASEPPFAPLNVSASDLEFVDEVLVTWTGTFKAQLYRIYRADNSLGIGATLLGETTANSFVDEAPLYFQSQYWYFVTAVNPIGESIFGDGDAGSPIVPDDLLPTDIVLSDNTIFENMPPNSFIGQLTTIGPGETYTFDLVAGENSATDYLQFLITGDELRSSATFDFEMQESYDIGVITQDERGLLLRKNFVIDIVDVQPEGRSQVMMNFVEGAEGRKVDLSWTGGGQGGTQLFQLQRSHTLAEDSWENVGEPSYSSQFEMPMGEVQCFFRVVPVAAE